MSDADAFLRAIADAPDDDAPRLIFADWLDDHGEHARAEFIRVQCEIERWPEDHPERRRLQRRADELLAEHRETWEVGLPGVKSVQLFRRGFLDRVLLDECEQWLANLAQLAKIHPPIRVDMFSLVAETVTTLASRPELAQWRRLGVALGDPNTSEPNLVPLLQSPYLTGLVELDCSRLLNPGPAEAQALASWPSLRGVRDLGIPNEFGLAGIEAVLAALGDTPLRSLTIDCSPRGSPVGPALVRWPGLARLHSLILWDRPTEADIHELASFHGVTVMESLHIMNQVQRARDFLGILASPAYPRLRDVEFNGTGEPAIIDDPLPTPADAEPLRRLAIDWLGLSERAVAWLAELPRLAGVRVLRFRRCRLTDRGVRWLAGSPNLAEVRTLDLSVNEFTASGWRALADSPFLGRLEFLDITNSRLDAASVEALAGARWIASLVELEMRNNPLSIEAVRELAVAPLERLGILDVSFTELTADGLRTLLAGRLPNLRSLRLGGNPLGAVGASILADWPGLANLRELDLSGCEIAEGLRTLAVSPFLGPGCTLTVSGQGTPSHVIGSLRERVRRLIVQ